MSNKKDARIVDSGIKPLDELICGVRLGDNVVWQVDNLDDYAYFADAFINQSIKDGFKCIYIRFAAHKPVLKPRPGLLLSMSIRLRIRLFQYGSASDYR
jgi:hypothetical protein